jgi:hypothetical protein
MTQMMTQTKKSEEFTEWQLWKQYQSAMEREYSWRLAYEYMWREFVRTGLRSADLGRTCADWSREWREALDRATAARKAWQHVAYPLFGIPQIDGGGTSS